MTPFQIGSLTPITLRHAGLAIATARAGGIALLDADACRDEALPRASANLRSLTERAPSGAQIGLRLETSGIARAVPLLELLAGRNHRVVLAGWNETSIHDALTELPSAERREVWVELSSAEELDEISGAVAGTRVRGLVLRGLECGGWVDGDPAYLLVQRAHGAGLDLPFVVRGGIGLHTAAACRLAGAAGVLVEEQLLLMPESPFPARWHRLLEEVDGKEATTLGEELGLPCRVISRRDFAAAQHLERTARDLETDPRGLDERRWEWRREADARLGWGDPRELAWPAGQAVGLAATYRDRYRTTGRLIQALRAAAESSLASAAEHPSMAPGSPLARSLGTRFPLIQGPMTRVSDTSAFAAAVADAGALPMLALALMRETEARELLQQTRERLGDRPWGVGILGFVPQERRDEQLRAIADVRPPFALIAGGRPDQAAALAEHGVETYLHVPSPALLRHFFDRGARRFVFEGRECGGHVGPLSSFALWETSVQTLLDHAPVRELEKVHVLFAGGIHDALSAAMVSALAAPLAERGVCVGAILGSAYLFTEEAVSTGAISRSFQDEAVACTRTVELTTGVGHVVRCAPTPFSEEFQAERRRLQLDGASADEIREALDALGLGRSRVAAKGLDRDADGTLVEVDEARQKREGMFMMGRLATLRSRVTSMEELHTEVTRDAQSIVERVAGEARPAARPPRTRPAQVAVVGVGCLLPGARDPESFWRNVLDRTCSITEIPARRFDWRVLYSADPKERDKIISKWGAFFDEVPFDPLSYGIPPNSMKSLSTSQLLALEVTRWALADAGYDAGDFDRENTAVIVGTGANGDLEQHFLVRSTLPLFVENLGDDVLKRLPEWTEESFAGVLANVTAGRIANRFDLGGANYTVDSACASSLTVIDLALSELATGRSNAVVAVGLDFEQTPYFYQGFSRVQAFSPRGKVQTFDQDADGIVMGEGAVVLVLKRLADAERDGDRIYGLIQSAAGSSDGKALGMTAPRSIGQQRALRRAYEEAGVTPAEIGLYEAHGTGTAVGDRAELETIHQALTDAGAPASSCAIGSVKTLVGHTKAAAGMVGLLKALMALHHRTLPPHAGVDKPLPTLGDPGTPPYLLREPRPWWRDGDRPRRAGVSAFGFGGTNFHAVLEEYRGGVERSADGADPWPWELLTLRAEGREDLAAELERLRAILGGAPPRLADLALTLAERAEERRELPTVLAVVSDGTGRLRETVETILGRLASGAEDPVGPLGHLAWTTPPAGPVAFLFPGQGSQAPDMGRDATLYLPELRAAFERADRATAGRYDGPLSGLVFPPSAFTEETAEAQRQRLADTRVAQPAIGALSLGYLELARRLGLTPAMAAGHSYGELTALHAAGVLSADDFLALSEVRGGLMAGADRGAMAAVPLPAEEVAARFDDGGGIVIANRNAPRQTVVSGPEAEIVELVEALTGDGVRARRLPVSGAFHSPLMAGAAARWAEELAPVELAAPAFPVYGNATAAPYPDDPEAVRSGLAEHLSRPVDFVSEVRRMYDDGARHFVELGPGGVLGGLVREILGDAPHTTASFGAGGTLKGVLDAVGRLLAAGVEVDLPALFADRPARRIELEPRAEATLPATVWMVDGGRVRRPHEPVGTTGELPLLDLEAIEKARSRPGPAPPAAGAALNGPPTPLGSAPPAIPAGAPTTTSGLEAYRIYQETMRHFLVLQERVMAQVLGQPEADAPAVAPHVAPHVASQVAAGIAAVSPAPSPLLHAGNGAERPPDVEPAPPAPPAPAEMLAAAAPMAVNREQVTEVMLGLLSERTGYPVDMLDPEQDLEADLSIDSIKRIEILDALKARLPESVRAAADGRMEDLVQQKTLAALVDTVVGLAGGEAGGGTAHPAEPAAPLSATPPTAPEAIRAAAESNGSSAARWVIESREEALDEASAIRPAGLFLITEDSLGVASRVADALRGHDVPVAVLERETLGSFAAIEDRVRELTEEHGPVQGVAHLAALSPNGQLSSLAQWREHTQTEVKSLFEVLRLTAADLAGRSAEEGACIVGAALLGGDWGRGRGGTGAPAAGGIYGVLKTLSTEYPDVHARVVDFDQSLPSGEMADIVVRELLTRAGGFEVGYPAGRRTVFTPRAMPLAADEIPDDLMPQDGWVVLITGGARGITAGLARRMAAPGVRLVVVGRSAPPRDEDPGLAGLDDAGALRRHFLAHAKAEGNRVTPAGIERRVEAVLKERELRENLAALAEGGAVVEYVAADASRPEGLGQVIAEIYTRHGRLDAVLHGVGVIDDRLLRDKSRESFERVFDTKADSTFLLTRALRPEGLRWVVLMSSISGRIGNRGQIDYAAANEVMNRLAWEMARDFPETRILSINWGPWSGPGMTSPEVLRALAARGLHAIEPDAGWRFLRDELAAGTHEVVEVIVGSGL